MNTQLYMSQWDLVANLAKLLFQYSYLENKISCDYNEERNCTTNLDTSGTRKKYFGETANHTTRFYCTWINVMFRNSF